MKIFNQPGLKYLPLPCDFRASRGCRGAIIRARAKSTHLPAAMNGGLISQITPPPQVSAACATQGSDSLAGGARACLLLLGFAGDPGAEGSVKGLK